MLAAILRAAKQRLENHVGNGKKEEVMSTATRGALEVPSDAVARTKPLVSAMRMAGRRTGIDDGARGQMV
jgi:hypothetical protein